MDTSLLMQSSWYRVSTLFFSSSVKPLLIFTSIELGVVIIYRLSGMSPFFSPERTEYKPVAETRCEMEEYLAKAVVLEQQQVELEPIDVDGFILDIGGGGEGIIGKLNGMQVVAIDKRLDELLETDNDSLKVVMDAGELKFLDDSFGAVTVFYTWMYIPNDEKPKVFSEISRVLRSGGRVYIWDVVIPAVSGDKLYFVAPLKIKLPDEEIRLGMGSV